MNKEVFYRKNILPAVVIAAIIFIIVSGDLKINFFITSGVLLFGFFVLSLMEGYLRIQHNIDESSRNLKDANDINLRSANDNFENKLNNISTNIDLSRRDILDAARTLQAENLNKFFMMKSSLEFKFLNFKYDYDKKFEEIKNNFDMLRSDLKLLAAEKEQYSGSIKSFWYRLNNFGDRLTPIILEYFLGKKIELSKDESGRIFAVGSILNFAKENDLIWGTGLIREEKMKMPQGVKILAVRGPLTRSLIEGCNVPEVYGDPAILMPLIYNPRIKKTHKIGIMPHYIDKNLWEGKDLGEDTKFIDVESYWKKVIDDILSCEMIKTSSLHGIIIAQAYGVPVIWEKYSDNIIGGEFKFQDYFLGMGLERQRRGEQLPKINNLAARQNLLIDALEKHYRKWN